MSDVWIVIPSFNEGAVIRSVVEPLANYNVIVVDDASTDDTMSQLKEAPIHLLKHILNLGQGAALQTGISYALRQGATYIITFDADGQHSAADIPELLRPLQAGTHQVVLGTRFGTGGHASGMSTARRLLLKAAIIYTRLGTRLALTDTHNGFRGFTAAAARRINITQNRMAHATQILTQIAAHGLSVCEVPVHIQYTEYSVKKGQRMSNSFNILWDSLMELFRL